jgi:hypothetical protein
MRFTGRQTSRKPIAVSVITTHKAATRQRRAPGGVRHSRRYLKEAPVLNGAGTSEAKRCGWSCEHPKGRARGHLGR